MLLECVMLPCCSSLCCLFTANQHAPSTIAQESRTDTNAVIQSNITSDLLSRLNFDPDYRLRSLINNPSYLSDCAGEIS